MELGKYKLAMRPKKYLTREFVVYKAAPEAMDDVIEENPPYEAVMPSGTPPMDNYMPEIPGMEDPSLQQIELADGGVVQREGFDQGGDVKKLKEYLSNDRNKFITEFTKYTNKYFYGNFKRAVESIGEKRNKIRGIYERKGIKNPGQGSKIQTEVFIGGEKPEDFSTKLKREPNSLDKFKNKDTFVDANVLAKKFGVDISTKNKRDVFIGFLKRAGVDKQNFSGKMNLYNIGDAAKKLPKTFENKKVKGETLANSQRLSIESELDNDLKNFKERIKKEIRTVSNELDVYVPNAVEDVGHAVSIKQASKYPNLFKDSNTVSLQSLVFQDPEINRQILSKNMEGKFDSVYKELNDLVDKKITPESRAKLIQLNKKLSNLRNETISKIKNLSKENKYFKGQEKRIPLIEIDLPKIGETFKSQNLKANMSVVDDYYRYGNINQINPTANKLADLSPKELSQFENKVISQYSDNAKKYYLASGFPQKEVSELGEMIDTRMANERLKNLNSSEKKAFSNFGSKLSSFGGGVDPTDVLKMIPEKEYQIMKGAMSKVGNLATMGARGAQELLVGTNPLGIGITAALTVPFMVADLAEGKRFSEALQNQVSALTLGLVPEADKRIIEEIGGPEAGVGFEIQQNIDKLKSLQNDLREAESKQQEDMMDPEASFAQSSYLDNTRKELQRTFEFLLPYLNERGQIIAPEYNAYLKANNKAQQERTLRKGIGKLEAYDTGFDDMSIPQKGPFQQEIDKYSKVKEQLEKNYFEKQKQPSQPLEFLGGVDTYKAIPPEELINQYLAYGGRVGLEKGGDPKDKPIVPINPMMDEGPQDPSRRTFIQGAGGVGLAGLLLGTGLLKLGKSVAVPSKIGSMIKNSTAPSWMEALITKVMKEGTDIPIPKRPGVTAEKISIKELKFKNPDTGKMETITLKIDEAKDTIDVDYIGDNTLAGQGVNFKLSPKEELVYTKDGKYLTSKKVKGEYEFYAHEAEPRVVNWDGDIEFDGEIGVRKIIDLNSDISGLKSFVTGGKGVDKNVAKLKKETVDKIEKNPGKYLEDAYDANYYDPSLPTHLPRK